MKVGVTGTREGMTSSQVFAFGGLECLDSIREFHHGSCCGVDVGTARLVKGHLGDTVEIHRHPGPLDDPNQEDSGVDTVIHEPKNHFARNRDIVDAVDLLIVVPREMERQERGGTWYTMGYAEKKGKQIKVIWPDGTVESKP